jgi:hypothetical protein
MSAVKIVYFECISQINCDASLQWLIKVKKI